MDRLRFGILSFPEIPYDTLLNNWRIVEELGFDSAWLADDPDLAVCEAWTVLGALARDVQRLRIGTLVTSITPRHPALLATQILSIDHLSGGRVEVGLGAGGNEGQYAMIGIEPWQAKERLHRFEEQAMILHQLLQGNPKEYEGRYYRSIVHTILKPVQTPRPPLIIAAHGKRGLKIAARYGDGWNSLGGQPYPEARTGKRVTLAEAVAITKQRNEQLDEYCHELGRNPSHIRRSIAAYRPVPDPLSSLDAFDEYVGAFREIGIEEIIFYWPPLPNFIEKQPVSTEQWMILEKIVAERFTRSTASEFK
jgi:alkanesulfonate monooxygenase SsuD/methylene tetrahydromethanopterin reductase-like flavin-dependent oxidoreductase (luciferase family)